MTTAVPRRLFRAFIALIGVASALAALTVAAASSASATTTGQPHQGKGYLAGGGDFVGYYLTSNGVRLYCLSPRKALPSSITLRTTKHYAGVSTAASHQLAYALTRWGAAASPTAAAAESQLLNTIAGNKADVARRAASLPKSVATIVQQHLALTRRYYGPYVTTVRTPTAVLPGQTATGTVVIKSATGHRVTNATVLLTSSTNGSVPKKIKTDSTGVGHFNYRATDVGEVRVTATALDLPTVAMHENSPSSSQQHMVSPAAVVKSRGSASFQRSPSGFANTYACTSTCDGKPATTLRACAPANGVASRIAYHYEGKIAYVVFAASKSAACKTLALTLKDGDHVSAGWQYRTHHTWSKELKAAGAFVVDCPAAPPVGVTMTYNCTKASVTIGLAKLGAGGTWTPLVNPSKHRMVLVIGGATQQRIFADHGHQALFTAQAACGSHTTYTAQAGVQRANGQYNYGLPASVTTP